MRQASNFLRLWARSGPDKPCDLRGRTPALVISKYTPKRTNSPIPLGIYSPYKKPFVARADLLAQAFLKGREHYYLPSNYRCGWPTPTIRISPYLLGSCRSLPPGPLLRFTPNSLLAPVLTTSGLITGTVKQGPAKSGQLYGKLENL